MRGLTLRSPQVGVCTGISLVRTYTDESLRLGMDILMQSSLVEASRVFTGEDLPRSNVGLSPPPPHPAGEN